MDNESSGSGALCAVENLPEPMLTYQKIGLLLGPAVMLFMFMTEPVGGLNSFAWLTAGATAWVAIWWATEAVPIPITALLPLVIFPLLKIDTLSDLSRSYSSPVVYLLIGGFILALGLQRWSLHRRIALYILSHIGSTPGTVVWGFMLVTALVSMWVSNTATTLMMFPIALSVSQTLAPDQNNPHHRNFMTVQMLAIAYAASIGGLGTLVGSPPNLFMAGFLQDKYNITIGFTDWMKFGIPLVVFMLPVTWWVLTRIAYPFKELSSDRELVKRGIAAQYQALGKISAAEKRMAAIFMCVVILWISRDWIVSVTGMTNITDTGIALIGAFALFIFPSGEGKPLMNWHYAKQLPWDVVLLYGGGMALATAIIDSGLAASFGDMLSVFSQWHLIALILAITAIIMLLTELTNNSATIATFMPIVAILSVSAHVDLVQLAVPATIAASCAFMLPVSTPPNAIVYGSGYITLPQMAWAGLLVNLFSLILIPVITYTVLTLWF